MPSVMDFTLIDGPEIAGVNLFEEFLPWGVEVWTSGRWTLPKAGSVKFDREAEG